MHGKTNVHIFCNFSLPACQNIYIVNDGLHVILSTNTIITVQSYWACFGLYPSSCMWKTKDHNVSETGSLSVLRWMGQDKPTQLGPLEIASLNH
jgi:hypothetical protein